MSAHTLHVHRSGTAGNRPMPDSDAIESHWASTLRSDYRRLRMYGVPRSSARSVLVGSYFVGLNAARQAAHLEELEAIKARYAA